MIEKNVIIGKIYKILPMKESLDAGLISNEDFESYITKQYIYFSGLGIDEKVKDEVLITLRGLIRLYKELKVKDIKSSVLRLTNIIDRGI